MHRVQPVHREVKALVEGATTVLVLSVDRRELEEQRIEVSASWILELHEPLSDPGKFGFDVFRKRGLIIEDVRGLLVSSLGSGAEGGELFAAKGVAGADPVTVCVGDVGERLCIVVHRGAHGWGGNWLVHVGESWQGPHAVNIKQPLGARRR